MVAFFRVSFGGSLTKHCVCWVHGHLVLGSITNQPLGVCECYIARSGPVSLVIGNDFHFSVLEDAHTGIGGAQIDSDCWSFRHLKQQKKETVTIVILTFLTSMSLYTNKNVFLKINK